MIRRVLPKISESISPNVVPLIDVMFLLLLFLLFASDLSRRDAPTLTLPVADCTLEPGRQPDPETTVNVLHSADDCPLFENGARCGDAAHWTLAMHGLEVDVRDLHERLQVEADESLEPQPANDAGKVLSSRRLLLRSDGGAPYGLIQRVIATASEVGIYKLELAAKPPSSRG